MIIRYSHVRTVLLSAAILCCGCAANVNENHSDVGQLESTIDKTNHKVKPKPRVWVPDESEFKSGHVTLSGVLEPAVAAPGDTVKVRITIEPSLGWHVYAWEKRVPKDAIGRPTLIVAQTDEGFSVGIAEPDQDVIEKEDDILKTVSRFHKGTVTWEIPIEISDEVENGEYTLKGFVGFQACTDDDTSCDMPAAAEFQVPLSVASESKDQDRVIDFEEAKYKQASEAAKEQYPPEDDD